MYECFLGFQSYLSFLCMLNNFFSVFYLCICPKAISHYVHLAMSVCREIKAEKQFP